MNYFIINLFSFPGAKDCTFCYDDKLTTNSLLTLAMGDPKGGQSHFWRGLCHPWPPFSHTPDN